MDPDATHRQWPAEDACREYDPHTCGRGLRPRRSVVSTKSASHFEVLQWYWYNRCETTVVKKVILSPSPSVGWMCMATTNEILCDIWLRRGRSATTAAVLLRYLMICNNRWYYHCVNWWRIVTILYPLLLRRFSPYGYYCVTLFHADLGAGWADGGGGISSNEVPFVALRPKGVLLMVKRTVSYPFRNALSAAKDFSATSGRLRATHRRPHGEPENARCVRELRDAAAARPSAETQ